jgi:epoxyqueuosine reductase
MTAINHSANIKKLALDLGFDACGISKVENLTSEKKHLLNWLGENKNANLNYMANNIEKRENPMLLLENAKSIISVVLNYFPEKEIESDYKLSKYAYGNDYHFVIKEKLIEIENYIKENFPDANSRRFTDSAPVFDKAWAVKSGLGWIGKNSMLINPKLGSFFFIGELITSADLTYDNPFEKNYCGSCTKCIDNCPTEAIGEYEVDANKCISYWTIETKEEIPEDLASKFKGRIFGCDICQDVCPWNSKAKSHNIAEFKLSEQLAVFKNQDWENLDKETFNKLFKQSAVKRAGYNKLMKNIKQQKKFL